MSQGTEGIVLDDRLRSILCAIVTNFIDTTEPVGSRTLSKLLEVALSPATIRNLMADLSEQGFLEQPHTSAGRVPTHKAYRYYVDSCIDSAQLPEEVKRVIERRLNETSSGLVSMLTSTCRLIAGLTQFTGIVASPRLTETRLRNIEFVRIGANQVYMVLITRSNMIHHKIIEVSEDLPQEFLNSISAYLNEHFISESLADVRQRVVDSLLEEKEHYAQLLAQALRLSKRAFDLSEERELYIDGQSHIIKEFQDVEKIQRLLETLEEKYLLIELMDRTLNGLGVHVTIGSEIPIPELQDCSMITANYGNGENILGAIGVIGPTRMHYERVIPIVDYTARTLSEAISNQ